MCSLEYRTHALYRIGPLWSSVPHMGAVDFQPHRPPSTVPYHPGKVLDRIMVFSDIRGLRIRLDSFYFVDRDLTPTFNGRIK